MNQKQRIKDMIADIRDTLKTTTRVERIDSMLQQLMVAVEGSDIGNAVDQLKEQLSIVAAKVAGTSHVSVDTYIKTGNTYIYVWGEDTIVEASSWDEFCETINAIPGKD